MIGVERLHALRDGLSQLAQILLINRAGVIDLEGHDAGIAVFGGVSDERETADHLAIDDIVQFAAGSVWPLFRQDAKVIAVVRLRLAAADLVAFCRRLRGKFTQRTLVTIRRPVEAILLARAGDSALRIDSRPRAAVLVGIFILRVDIGERGLDRVELVASNPTIENLDAAGGPICG